MSNTHWCETEDDERWQRAIAKAYAAVMGYVPTMTPKGTHWDVELYRSGRLVGLAEIKRRRCTRTYYKTFKIDQVKVDAMIAEAERLGIWCIVLVHFDDGIFAVQVTAEWIMEHATHGTILRHREGDTEDPAWQWANRTKLWTRVTNPLERGEHGKGRQDKIHNPADHGRSAAR